MPRAEPLGAFAEQIWITHFKYTKVGLPVIHLETSQCRHCERHAVSTVTT